MLISWLWKKSLISDGQQFHLYQQTEQSLNTLTHWPQTSQRHTTLEIQIDV
jgi:hypothetical protein